MKTIVRGLIVGAIGVLSAVTPAISQPMSKWEPKPAEILKSEIAKIEAMFEALWQTDYCHNFDE
jgi:hypothetical protein